MKTKANYSYTIDKDNKIVSIVDQNLGNKSVTNDIENVIADICSKEDLITDEWGFIYKDSEEIWDGYDTQTESFVAMDEDDEETAKVQMMNYMAKKGRRIDNA